MGGKLIRIFWLLVRSYKQLPVMDTESHGTGSRFITSMDKKLQRSQYFSQILHGKHGGDAYSSRYIYKLHHSTWHTADTWYIPVPHPSQSFHTNPDMPQFSSTFKDIFFNSIAQTQIWKVYVTKHPHGEVTYQPTLGVVNIPSILGVVEVKQGKERHGTHEIIISSFCQ